MQSKTKEIGISEANLEHIFPKKPAKEWKNRQKMEPLLWYIGNLTMLGERLNQNVGNSEFKTKKQHYEKSSELEITKRVASEYSSWNEVSIRNRAENLVPLMTDVWNFNNPSRV